ncbi:MAG TPA: hypothetical protein VFV19_17465 [Candidatus Polarisedimenticolaceae bacterium]|nr:hypothetical protein [Candidatus Polarisedimenticolaceae bacterium]
MISRDRGRRILTALQAALGDVLAGSPASTKAAVLERLEAVVEAEVARERRRCVGLCEQRATLWQKTSATSSNVAAARDEARSRSNEAEYLADVLAVRPEPDAVDA